MTVEDLLQRRFVEYSGAQFQKLFYEIMKISNKDDFEMPEPYGNVGDYKCDGYLISKGHYFACYSPSNPTEEFKESYINSKLESDLSGLINNIKSGIWKYPLKEFIFILNMKYINTVPAPVLSKKQELEKTYEITIHIWTTYELKLIFNSLSLEEKKFILEKVYINEKDIDFNGAIISKIIEHMSTCTYTRVQPHNIMEFESKIIFNKLSDERKSELLCASYNIDELEKYMDNLSSDCCSIIQTLVINLYNESKTHFPQSSDLQFDYIKDKIYPITEDMDSMKIKMINDTKMCIMSKFIENCTIFESEVKAYED